MTQDSLGKRYLVKLLTNLIIFCLGLISQSIIARGLGPSAYGNFGFLTNFFKRIFNFMQLGTLIGFYIKLSKRQNDFGLILFYILFIGLVSLAVFIIAGVINVTDIHNILLPDQSLIYIYLAVIFVMLKVYEDIFDKIADALGYTVSKEKVKVYQKVFGLALIFTLYISDYFDLRIFYYYHFVLSLVLIFSIVWIIKKKRQLVWLNIKLNYNKIKTHIKEFYTYSHPLFLFGLVGLITVILDRWMLQKFSGSVQQGFFELSWKVGAICFLFTGAMTQLITREFSVAFNLKNISEMKRLFRRYIPMLYSIAAYFACFIAVEAKNVTIIIGGDGFQNASTTVMIMSFFPIHQTYGQLSGSVFYATDQTKLYGNIGISFMIVGFIIAYFLLAPKEMMGYNAGSSGLAVKFVILNILLVNVQLYYNSKLLKLNLWRFIAHQIISVTCLLVCALLAKYCVNSFFEFRNDYIISFLISGFLYSCLVISAVLIQPLIFGIYRKDLIKLINIIKEKIFQTRRNKR